jgi:hypothetical protein
MICPVCHGQHVIRIDGQLQPCPECGGFGEWNCCEGLQEQPPLTLATCCPVSASAALSCPSDTETSPEVSDTPPSQTPTRDPLPVDQAIPSPLDQVIQNTPQDHPNDDNDLLARWNQSRNQIKSK